MLGIGSAFLADHTRLLQMSAILQVSSEYVSVKCLRGPDAPVYP